MPSNASSPLPTSPTPISLVSIEPEAPDDAPAIEALLDEAFGADRHKKQSYRFRQHVGPVEALSLVARDRRQGRRHDPAMAGRHHRRAGRDPGPAARAHRSRRRPAPGADRRSADARKPASGHELGYAIVLLVGEVSYYGRFGFRAAAAHGLFMPGEDPKRLQVLELDPGALAGVSGDLWPILPKPARTRRYGT